MTIKKIILIGILAIFISCKKKEQVYTIKKETATEKETEDKNIISTQTKVILIKDCGLDAFLKDPKTPKLAKELFENKAINDDKALEYFEKLTSADVLERSFYFKVITNSHAFADGAYAEGLGYYGVEYVEQNTVDFITYFENKKCFNDDDLMSWTNIVLQEFSLAYENEHDVTILESYITKLNKNCKNCNASQKDILQKFINYLKEKWKKMI